MSSLSNESIISVRNVYKTYMGKHRKGFFKTEYREVHALNDITLDVERGEIFTLLGPNGAGKTTLIKILTTLLFPTKGKAIVAGYDVIKEANQVRKVINAMLMGERSTYWKLSGRQNLEFFGALYYIETRDIEERIEHLARELKIEEIIDRPVESYSSGQKYKLAFAKALINDPEILFLDEPTATLDPRSANEMRTLIKKTNNQGTTVFLTTHNMHEADELSDRIAILDLGQVIAIDSPQALKDQFLTEEMIHVDIKVDRPINGVIPQLQSLEEVVNASQKISSAKSEFPTVSLALTTDDAIISSLKILHDSGIRVLGMSTKQPTLEDVFLSLTGRTLSEDTSKREEVVSHVE